MKRAASERASLGWRGGEGDGRGRHTTTARQLTPRAPAAASTRTGKTTSAPERPS